MRCEYICEYHFCNLEMVRNTCVWCVYQSPMLLLFDADGYGTLMAVLRYPNIDL